MKVTVGKDKLVEGLKKVSAAVGSKERLNIMSGVMIEADRNTAPGAVEDEKFGRIILTATDGMMQIKTILPCKVDECGTACLPAKFLLAFAEALPDGGVEIDIRDKGTRAKISGGECKYSLMAFEAHNFPVMAGPKTGAKIDLRPEVFRELLRKVKYAAAGSAEARRILQGVNVCIDGGRMRMVATDGKRLSMVEYFFEVGKVEDVALGTLPSAAVKELYGLLGVADGERDVSVKTDGESVRIQGDGFEITTRLLADAYPNWTKVVPENPAHTATVERESFLEELRRAKAAAAAGDGRMVKMRFHAGEVVFEGQADDFSKSKTRLPVKYTGEESEFLINPALFEDVLEAIDDNEVTFGFDGSNQRLVIKCTVPFMAVIQPMRVG